MCERNRDPSRTTAVLVCDHAVLVINKFSSINSQVTLLANHAGLAINKFWTINSQVTLLAGDKDGNEGHEEGQGTSALFNGPTGLAVAVSQVP